MVTGETWRLGRRPALDGLRGVAVLLVIAFHVSHDSVPSGGVVGVTLFFVLSGFLIGALLTQERDRTSRVDVPAFLRRRAHRLVPALALLVNFCVALTAMTGQPFATPEWAATALLFSSNWTAMHAPLSWGLEHTWTLGVEAQFYILAAVLVAWLRGRRLLVTLGTLAAVSLSLRLALVPFTDLPRTYHGTDTNIGLMLLGALLGASAVRQWCPPKWAAPVALVGLAALSQVPDGQWARSWVALPAAATGAVLILSTNSRGGLLEAGWLQYVGRRSYGLYLWHVPLLWVVFQGDFPGGWLLAPYFAATFAAAEMSWWLVEGGLSACVQKRADATPVRRTSAAQIRRSPDLEHAGL